MSHLTLFHSLMVRRPIKASGLDEVEPVLRNNGLLHLGSIWLTSRVLGGVSAPCQLFILPVTLCNYYRLGDTRGEGERNDSLEVMGADWDQAIEFHLKIDSLN